MNNTALESLEKRNDYLKSELLHQQLKYGKIPLNYYKKYCLIIINEYKKCRSIYKSASNVGIEQKVVMDWYIQGQLKNQVFRSFYLTIKNINQKTENNHPADDEIASPDEPVIEFEGDYVISQYGDGWSYKTYLDGEKIFIISDELESLKKKVKDKHLPIE